VLLSPKGVDLTAQILTVVCAWCNRVVVQGSSPAAVTHTICPSCSAWTFECQSNPDAFFDPTSELGRLIPSGDYFGNIH